MTIARRPHGYGNVRRADIVRKKLKGWRSFEVEGDDGGPGVRCWLAR